MEYASNAWGGSTHITLLERIKTNVLRSISSPSPIGCLSSLQLWRSVACLSIFYSYFHANCFFWTCKLHASIIPATSLQKCLYSTSFPNCPNLYASNPYLHYFIPLTGKLWSSIPLSLFPFIYDECFQERSVKTPLQKLITFLTFYCIYFLKQLVLGIFLPPFC